MKRLIQTATMLAATLLLSSCAAFAQYLEENETAARAAVTYGTIKAIDGDAEKAARAEEIALEVLEYATGDTYLTISLVMQAVNEQIRWERLDQADQYLVNQILLEIQRQLEEKFGSGDRQEDLRLSVEKIATWVLDAARRAQQPV